MINGDSRKDAKMEAYYTGYKYAKTALIGLVIFLVLLFTVGFCLSKINNTPVTSITTNDSIEK